jgi:energy-coupling factor transporter ATP-binding protein EcfA2
MSAYPQVTKLPPARKWTLSRLQKGERRRTVVAEVLAVGLAEQLFRLK